MAKELTHISKNKKIIFGWLGSIFLLLIIPIKLIRFESLSNSTSFLIGIAPSFLGSIGLLFLLLSSSGYLSKYNLLRITFFVGFVSISVEFMQLLPRPGFLKYIFYTFDWMDMLSSMIGLLIAFIVAKIIIDFSGKKHSN